VENLQSAENRFQSSSSIESINRSMPEKLKPRTRQKLQRIVPARIVALAKVFHGF